MNIESIEPVIKRASGWVIIWGIVTFVCGILAIISSDVLFWNRADHWLLDLGRRNWTSVFCFRCAQRRRVSLADTCESALRNGGNLFIGEPAFGYSLAEPSAGDFSTPRERFGVCSLLLSQAIPPFDLAAN